MTNAGDKIKPTIYDFQIN